MSFSYEEARDKYGELTKDQRWKVLDKVSSKTSTHSGPEAEKAFVEAVEEVLDEEQRKGLYNYYFGSPFGPVSGF